MGTKILIFIFKKHSLNGKTLYEENKRNQIPWSYTISKSCNQISEHQKHKVTTTLHTQDTWSCISYMPLIMQGNGVKPCRQLSGMQLEPQMP